MSSENVPNGQESQIFEQVFNPSLEVSVRGSSVRDSLYQILGSLTVAADCGHTSVVLFTNSSYIVNVMNVWSRVWISLAGDDGIWHTSDGDLVPHQDLFEAVLEFQSRLEMQVFLINPVVHSQA